MPPHRTLDRSDEARLAFCDLRDHAPLPYLRERAAALLKIAAGMRSAVVARSGLLRPRDPDTIYDWLTRWVAEGIDGLAIRDGRGRKPAFSPPARDDGSRSDGGATSGPA